MDSRTDNQICAIFVHERRRVIVLTSTSASQHRFLEFDDGSNIRGSGDTIIETTAVPTYLPLEFSLESRTNLSYVAFTTMYGLCP